MYFEATYSQALLYSCMQLLLSKRSEDFFHHSIASFKFLICLMHNNYSGTVVGNKLLSLH